MRKSKFTESQIVTTLKQVECENGTEEVKRVWACLGSLNVLRPDSLPD